MLDRGGSTAENYVVVVIVVTSAWKAATPRGGTASFLDDGGGRKKSQFDPCRELVQRTTTTSLYSPPVARTKMEPSHADKRSIYDDDD